MKKTIHILLLLLLSTAAFAQIDYFTSGSTICPIPNDAKSKKDFALGLECIRMNKYLGAANKIFNELIKVDSTFCDAYFLSGYTYEAYKMDRDAAAMFYMADSLAHYKCFEYKQSLAAACMRIGKVNFARKKYVEMTTYFSGSPEGYYGIALTSTMIGDVKYGLENIIIAQSKYLSDNKDADLLRAILLNLNGKYEESLKYFEKIKSVFSKNDHFNGTYAQSLYEVATLNHDEEMMKLARKHYNKVKDKSQLTDYLRSKFETTN